MKIVIIGAGPGGEAAARKAAQLGAQVTLVEKAQPGGTCLNRGCIPSKTLLSYAKKYRDACQISRAKDILNQYQSEVVPALWRQMREAKKQVVQTIHQQLDGVYKAQKVTLVRARAEFLSDRELQLTAADGAVSSLEFDAAIIASGSQIFLPPPLDSHREELLTSDNIFDLEQLPKSVLIVGGGAVGCEFACLLHALGVQTTLVEKTVQLLPGEEPQIAGALKRSFEQRGIAILTESTLTHLHKTQTGWNAQLSGGQTLQVEHVLACVGRRNSLDALRLEKAGVQKYERGVAVNEKLQTSAKNIYAVGDVTGLSLLAHAAGEQGEIAAINALGGGETYDGKLTPRCLYSWPQVASVGLFLHQAKAQNLDVKAQRFFFAALGKALAENESEGFIQIISETQSGRILGAQMIGPHVTEIIHIVSVALAQDLTRQQLSKVLFAHPTIAESIHLALQK